ncbi:MAG: hypothetical protein ACOCWH_05165 [Spirochaetota bacterium]
MFKNLTVFEYTRSVKEAIGFYLAYLLLFIVVGAVFGAVASFVTTMDPVAAGTRAGMLVAFLLTAYLAFSLLRRKRLLNNFGFILLALLSVLLALILGGIGGLIPVAYLTTRPNGDGVTDADRDGDPYE